MHRISGGARKKRAPLVSIPTVRSEGAAPARSAAGATSKYHAMNPTRHGQSRRFAEDWRNVSWKGQYVNPAKNCAKLDCVGTS